MESASPQRTNRVGFHFREVPGVNTFTEMESGMVGHQGLGEGREGELKFNGDRVSVQDDGSVLVGTAAQQCERT